jgi:hypothetical protein
MATVSSNVFSQEDLQYINQLPEVLAAKAKITDTSSKMVYFSIHVTDTIRTALQNRFGLDLSSVTEIPMRWIQGDTAPHIDSGASTFENTYLVYLNTSAGDFVIDETEYPITENTGFVFSEGVSHKTQGTGSIPRLLVGPMNEFAQPVGSAIAYFSNYNNAITKNSLVAIALGGSLVLGTDIQVGSIGSYTSWRVAAVSDPGSSIPSGVYANGYDLSQIANLSYYVYPAVPCFLEGTQVLCKVDVPQVDFEDIYLPIEKLSPGTLVKTSRDGYKQVVLLGKGVLQNPGNTDRIENRLYKCSPVNYPTLTSDLYITGGHSILVNELTDSQREQTVKQLGRIFATDNKYRLLAQLDERAEPWASEDTYTIWHVALENESPTSNYGIYVNGGLLVESSSINFLKNKSNMQV